MTRERSELGSMTWFGLFTLLFSVLSHFLNKKFKMCFLFLN